MNLKVLHGTPKHDAESLCRTCRNAQIMKGARESEILIKCNELGNHVKVFDQVTECSLYDDKRNPSRWDMEQLAWVLVTNQRTREVGFISAKEVKRRKDENDDHGLGVPWPE